MSDKTPLGPDALLNIADPPFTPRQEARIREIVQETVGAMIIEMLKPLEVAGLDQQSMMQDRHE